MRRQTFELLKACASLRLLSPRFFAHLADRQPSNSFLRTRIALRLDLCQSIFAELAKIASTRTPKRVWFNHRYYRLRTRDRDWKHDDVTHRQQYISWRNDWCNPRRLALWASTRVCVGAVASERRRNHRSMIEECYQQLSMASDMFQRYCRKRLKNASFLAIFCEILSIFPDLTATRIARMFPIPCT